MARGGKREGAGRPKGARNKATEEARQQAAKEGETPLAYMLRVMRDGEADAKRRDAMAQAAAPYLHPKLSTVEHSGKGGGPIRIQKIEVEIVDPSAAGS